MSTLAETPCCSFSLAQSILDPLAIYLMRNSSAPRQLAAYEVHAFLTRHCSPDVLIQSVPTFIFGRVDSKSCGHNFGCFLSRSQLSLQTSDMHLLISTIVNPGHRLSTLSYISIVDALVPLAHKKVKIRAQAKFLVTAKEGEHSFV